MEIIESLPRSDLNRVYILGHSMGAHGINDFIFENPNYFAAAVPSAGSGLEPGGLEVNENYLDIPIWAFHGKEIVLPIIQGG